MSSALLMALPDESQQLFEHAGIQVHYSGIGKINACFKAYELIMHHGCDTLINLGSAGSTHFARHQLVEVSRFVQRDMDVSALGFAVGTTPMDQDWGGAIDLEPYFADMAHGVCGTGDNFETESAKSGYNLVDMEGYAIAKVCKKLGVRLISIKYISDGADASAGGDWQDNLLLGAQKLLQCYQSIK
jgi:adenosylhomocysteine nucleosidase